MGLLDISAPVDTRDRSISRKLNTRRITYSLFFIVHRGMATAVVSGSLSGDGNQLVIEESLIRQRCNE